MYKFILVIKDGVKYVEVVKFFDLFLFGFIILIIFKEKYKIVRVYEEGSYSVKRKKMR